jgi:ABC-type sugar transport system ATPase subunit
VAGLTYAGVRKEFGEVKALRGLDLEVADGELLALLGPSGSGKSTALRLAAGLDDVTAGTIHIGSRDVTHLAPARRNVSMVFQSYALFPHLTVAENIGFGLRARGVPRADAARGVAEAARITGCDALLGRKPHELSGGERQRVALARALARHPDVFLLDEPLSNLDAQLRVDTRAELKRLHARLGTTMVYVTHDQIEALTLGTRVAVIDGGVLQQVGSPTEIYERPVNRFVARFVGSPAMNLLPAAVVQGMLRVGPFAFDPAEVAVDRPRVDVGVRPEHVEIVLDDQAVPATVEVVEMAGSETLVYVHATGADLVARVPPELALAVGAMVGVRIAAKSLYVFDAETGVALSGIRR